MKAFIGLGNPDAKYVGTRHNIGFFILDQIVNISSFKASHFDYFYSTIQLNDEKILLVKPSTYMNHSGRAIRQLLSLEPTLSINDIIIIYDDYHLPLGKIRFRPKGSDGGHNGIKNIIYELNSDEFPRLRFGISEPDNHLIDYVLSPFKKSEVELMHQLVDKSIDGLKYWIKNGISKTMSEFNSTNLATN